MIIYPLPTEKELDALNINTTTQVFYATVSDHALIPTPPEAPNERGDMQVNGLVQQPRDDLCFDDQPPAYDAQLPHGQPISAGATVTGDVKDPKLFVDGRDSGIPRRSPPPAISDRLISPGSSGAARRTPAFEPLVMHSKSKKLQDGFFSMLPPTDTQPHPFTLRDVTESDWKKFLADLQMSARLSNSDESSPSRERSNFFQNMGNMFRSLSTNAAGKQTNQRNHRGAAALIDTWNQNFFHRRGLDVILAKGSRRLSGDKSLPPPDFLPSDLEGNDIQTRSTNGWPSSLFVPPISPVPPMPPVSPMAHVSLPVPPTPLIPPMPGAFMNGVQPDSKLRSHSSTSLSSDGSDTSDSNSDSDSDSESDESRDTRVNANSCGHSATCSRSENRARRAARRARRSERREKRRVRRQARHDMRVARKMAKWEAKMAVRGFGRGFGTGPINGGFGGFGRGGDFAPRGGFPSRGACHATTWNSGFGYRGNPMGGPVGGPLALVQGFAALMNKEEDGYYRLIVIDRV